jgi:hypothetical protein
MRRECHSVVRVPSIVPPPPGSGPPGPRAGSGRAAGPCAPPARLPCMPHWLFQCLAAPVPAPAPPTPPHLPPPFPAPVPAATPPTPAPLPCAPRTPLHHIHHIHRINHIHIHIHIYSSAGLQSLDAEVEFLELYSCFPVALAVGARELGLRHAQVRRDCVRHPHAFGLRHAAVGEAEA